jgi:hypothetical protein
MRTHLAAPAFFTACLALAASSCDDGAASRAEERSLREQAETIGRDLAGDAQRKLQGWWAEVDRELARRDADIDGLRRAAQQAGRQAKQDLERLVRELQQEHAELAERLDRARREGGQRLEQLQREIEPRLEDLKRRIDGATR